MARKIHHRTSLSPKHAMKHFQTQHHPAAEAHTPATLIACPDYTDLARANDSERAQDTLRSAALRCAPLRSAALRCAPLRSAALRLA
jgi:hypothetical protein